MKSSSAENYKQELKASYGPLSDIVEAMEDPFAGAALLHVIEKEKNSTNLIVKEINSKFDNILEKLDMVCGQMSEINRKLGEAPSVGGTPVIPQEELLSDRDVEILQYIKTNRKVCADDIKKKFKYRGRNAASARLSNMFKNDLLKKVYVGRKVYYAIKS